jgi:hypothetical protein
MFYKSKPPSFFFKKPSRSDSTTDSNDDPEKPSTDERSSSDESYLSENEIRLIRAKLPSRFRWWWVILGLMHLALFTTYVVTMLSLRSEINRLRKFGPQLVDCK